MTNNPHADQLHAKITDRDAVVGIIGLGYVGLPLALAFTEKGFRVLGFDVDPEKVDKINRGESYIKHLDPTRLTRATGLAHPDDEATETPARKSEIRNPKSEIEPGGAKLEATTDFTRLAEADAILICVPTPLGPHKEPDMRYVESSTRAVRDTLRPGQLIVLESTTYPGTTDDLLRPILESSVDNHHDAPDTGEPGGHVTEPRPPDSSTRSGPSGLRSLGMTDGPGDLVGTSEIRNPKSEMGAALGGRELETQSSELKTCGGEDAGRSAPARPPDSSTPSGASRLRSLGMTDGPGDLVGTSEIRNPKSEMKCGEDFFLAFSPEREDPGNPSFGTTNTPKIVGGVDQVSGDLAQTLYDQIIDRTVRVSTARVAEACKLTENIFRSVNIALVNELKVIYDRLGIDVWEVLDAAATKPFGFMRFNPGPGLGGHCIPLDPFYLAWRAREAGVPTKFIELAGEINTSMPGYVIEKLQAALNDRGKTVKGAKALVLGLAYKPDIDDPRESPAFEIIDRLLALGADVSYHDPHIPVAPSMRSWPDLPRMESRGLTEEFLRSVDAAVLVTDHKAVDYDLVLDHAPLIVDTRGIYRDANGKVIQA